MERRIGPFFAVLVSLVGGALLVLAAIVFVLWGYCEDECDKPPRTEWAALTAALPFALGAIGLMWVAAYLFMIGPPERRGSWPRALGVAVGSCVLFTAAFAGLIALVTSAGEGTTPWIVGVPAVVVWEAVTSLAARRFAVRA